MIHWTARNMFPYIGQRGTLTPTKKAANHFTTSRVQILDARAVRDSLQLLVYPENQKHQESCTARNPCANGCPQWIAAHRFTQCEPEHWCAASVHQGDTPERGTIRAHGTYWCHCVEFGMRHVGECWDGTEPCEHADCEFCHKGETE